MKKDFQALQDLYWKKQNPRSRRDLDHPIIKSYVEPKLEYILRYVPIRKETRILEVGAGDGYFSKWLDSISDLTATDYSASMLERNPSRNKVVADARNLNFPEKSFDVVFCHALLHHIHSSDRENVIRELNRVSKEFVIVIEPNRSNPLMALFGFLKKEERGLLDFSLDYLRSLFLDVGLEVVSAVSFGLLTPNRMPMPRALLGGWTKWFEHPMPLGISNILIVRKKSQAKFADQKGNAYDGKEEIADK